MNSLVCFITGTNAVGKSTLARQLIETFGGVERVTEKITYCKDGNTCFLGKYFHGGKFEGVDTYPTTNGLYKHVQTALNERRVVFAEGFYLHTFGLNLQKAILQGEKQMVVFLYAPSNVLNIRLLNRGGAWNNGICNQNTTKYVKRGKEVVRNRDTCPILRYK